MGFFGTEVWDDRLNSNTLMNLTRYAGGRLADEVNTHAPYTHVSDPRVSRTINPFPLLRVTRLIKGTSQNAGKMQLMSYGCSGM